MIYQSMTVISLSTYNAIAQNEPGNALKRLGEMLGINESPEFPIASPSNSINTSPLGSDGGTDGPDISLVSQSYDEEEFSDHIVGEVTNNGTALARYVEITASFRDPAGQITGTSFTYADPNEIQPGDSSPFEKRTRD